ncbi:MAG: ABC transporter permease [Candidatus Brockarchaeota archaeon]|nr:ABC transporter permease [Candidatus Brockarchaeota archaeon]
MAGALTVCRKELADHLGSRRYVVLFALILLLSTLSAYQGTEYIKNNPNAGFMAIFSGARFGFSFTYLMVFFGPIIGLALGFDAVNKERTSGTLSVLLCQPIFRDSVINGKFMGGTAALSLLAASTIGIMCGVAMPILGFGPGFEDALRIVLFALLTIVYLTFWLALGLLFSTVTKKTSTSILLSISTWLFCSIVISIIAALVANYAVPIQMPSGPFNPGAQGTQEYRELMQRRTTIQMNIQRISPAYLYNEAGSSILGTMGGSFGFGELGRGTPFQRLELTQALATRWPQILAIVVGMVVCFAATYMLFLRMEIRPEG